MKMLVVEKLTKVLRVEMGKVYGVAGSIFFDGKLHASVGSEEAIIVLNFSYLADEDDGELSRSKSILDGVVDSYQSNGYMGDLEKTILERREIFQKISLNKDIQFWKTVFERMMPHKCIERCVYVTFHDEVEHLEERDEDDSDEEEDSEDSDEEFRRF